MATCLLARSAAHRISSEHPPVGRNIALKRQVIWRMPGNMVQQSPSRLNARALLIGDRIDLVGLERPDVLATSPLAFRSGNCSAANRVRGGRQSG
jgi:hypothetical protein